MNQFNIIGCESWTVKKAEHRRIDAFELWCWRRLLRVCPLDCKEIQPVHSKGDQSWVFIGGTDVEDETPILWPPDAKSWLIWKDPDPGKDWGQEEKGTTEDEMVGWHHRFNGCGFGWTLGVADGQGDLACCGSWGRIELDHWVTELNCTEYTANGNHASLGFTAHRFWVRFFVSWWILCHTMPLFWAFADPSRKTVHQMSKGLCLFNYLTKDYIVIKSRNRI